VSLRSSDVRVSVVLPTRNRVSLLPRSLGSVLSQTEMSLECIVVDDASTDGTAAWLAAVDDPRVRVVNLERPAGAAVARNRGIEVAAGRFVAFQDSDDEWLPNKLELQLAVFRSSPRPAVVYCGLWIDWDGAREHAVADLGADPFARLLAYAGPVTTPALVIDRDAVGDDLRFDERLPAMQEYDLLLRLVRSHPIACVLEPLYVRHEHAGPRVSDPESQVRARRIIMEKYRSDLAARPAVAAYHWWRLAAAQRRSGDHAGARDSVATAVRLHPRQPRMRAVHVAGRLGLRPFDLAWVAQEHLERWRARRRRRNTADAARSGGFEPQPSDP
jgi:glycosyltransferase involved in cell wall biosynthesis